MTFKLRTNFENYNLIVSKFTVSLYWVSLNATVKRIVTKITLFCYINH